MGLSVTKSSPKGSKSNYPQSPKGTGIRIAKDGGVRVGVTGCNSKRAASNVKAVY